MNQTLSFVTLGVSNLRTMRDFYVNVFGWQPHRENGEIVFFKLGGLMLGLFGRAELAEDAGVAVAPQLSANTYPGFTLAHNVHSQARVDELFAEFAAGGVTIVKRPEKVSWGGYRGYIADPENNLWEICYNPMLILDGQGEIVQHAPLSA